MVTRPASTPFPVHKTTTLLGEVISWTCTGVAVRHADLLAALAAAELDTSVARELAPRHAFTRACRKLSDRRIIRPVAEDDRTITFQFTAEHRHTDRIEYELETMLTLDKKTGTVTCKLPGLATLAQEQLDQAIEARSGGDVTRVIQRLFEHHADLFAIRPQGGCYFVPRQHGKFVSRVQSFLTRINGQMLRFPVPVGVPEGDRSVRQAVADGLASLIAEHRQAVGQFGSDTRPDTLERAADRIRVTKFKIQAYAEYLAGERVRLDRAIAEAECDLRARVAQIGQEPSPAL